MTPPLTSIHAHYPTMLSWREYSSTTWFSLFCREHALAFCGVKAAGIAQRPPRWFFPAASPTCCYAFRILVLRRFRATTYRPYLTCSYFLRAGTRLRRTLRYPTSHALPLHTAAAACSSPTRISGYVLNIIKQSVLLWLRRRYLPRGETPSRILAQRF